MLADQEVVVRLLGGFDIEHLGNPLRIADGAQGLLALVVLSDRPLHRPFIARTLWPDVNHARARARLRTALWRTNQSAAIVVSQSDRIMLGAGVRADTRTVLRETEKILGTPLDELDPRSLTHQHWLAELLPGWDEDWVVAERERFRQRGLHAIERLSEVLCHRGQYAEAVEAGLRAVALDPLRESAHRAVIEAHLANGNRADAIRQFKHYESVIAADLGLTPTTAMSDLIGMADPP